MREQREKLSPFDVLSLAVLTWASLSSSAAGCESPLTLSIQGEGDAVRFTWDATLDPGEQFVLYNFPLEDLPNGPVPSFGIALYSGGGAEFLHEDVLEPGYQLTCEGPGGEIRAASNMAFKLPYSLPRDSSWNHPTEQGFTHLLSIPLVGGQVDVGGTGEEWPCGSPGDGDATPDDILCGFWDHESVESGSFAIEMLDVTTDSWLARVGIKEDGGPPEILGSRVDLGADPFRGAGLLIRVDGDDAANEGFIIGAHDPSFAGRRLRATESGGPDSADVISIPFNTRFKTTYEVLCGLEGFDWVDGDADGSPDSCTNGIFSDLGLGVCQVAVQWRGEDRLWHGSIAQALPFGLSFIGENSDLVPGRALYVSKSGDCGESIFLSPHY